MRARRNAHDSAKTDYGLDCGERARTEFRLLPRVRYTPENADFATADGRRNNKQKTAPVGTPFYLRIICLHRFKDVPREAISPLCSLRL